MASVDTHPTARTRALREAILRSIPKAELPEYALGRRTYRVSDQATKATA
jgi:hypothetical protein